MKGGGGEGEGGGGEGGGGDGEGGGGEGVLSVRFERAEIFAPRILAGKFQHIKMII